MGEHREGHVSVPGVVFPDLVFVESDFVLRGAEAFFDGPAGTGPVHEFDESGVIRIVTMVESQLTVVDGSSDHVFVVSVGGGYQRPVVDPESFAANAAGPALPRGVIQFVREVLDSVSAGTPASSQRARSASQESLGR